MKWNRVAKHLAQWPIQWAPEKCHSLPALLLLQLRKSKYSYRCSLQDHTEILYYSHYLIVKMLKLFHGNQHKNPKCFNLGDRWTANYSKCKSFQYTAGTFCRSWSLKSCFGPIYIKNVKFSISQLYTLNNEGSKRDDF